MVKKSDIVRDAVREGDFKKALRIAKGIQNKHHSGRERQDEQSV